MTQTFLATAKDGRLKMAEYTKAKFMDFLKANENARIEIRPVLPESNKQRRYLEGAIFPLVTYYQEHLDHRNYEDRRMVREWLKQELNGGIVIVNGEQKKIGKSTKGSKELNAFLERVMDWLVENYQPPAEAYDVKTYEDWRDRIYPTGDGADNFIDYLVETGVLRK